MHILRLYSSYSTDQNFEDISKHLISDSDDNDEYDNFNDNDELKKSLKDWAVSFNVSLVALTALLCILKLHKCFKYLPSDARSILNTPYSVSIVPVEPGHYSHLGLAVNLKRFLEKVKNNISNIDLLINVDGLQLFKSNGIDV